jgi:hypothetical protein
MSSPIHQTSTRPASPLARRPAIALLALVAFVPVVPVAPARAQLPDPYLIPRGALRVAFDPQWLSYAELFDAAGTRIPLGAYFSADSLGANLLPTADAAEAAVRSITADAAFRFNAGRLQTRMDADIRRFPFSFAVGLSSRLTVTATVPLVVTRVKSTSSLDTTGADAGWNPASSRGSSAARDSLVALLAELEAAGASLDAAIAGGSFGCPSSATCDEARALSLRIATLTADLRALTGIPGLATGDGTTPAPPFAPLAASAAGQAIRQAIADVSTALQTLGQTGIAGTMPLPTHGVESDAVDVVLQGSDFGYAAASLNPVETVKLSGLGDVELGLRYGLATGQTFRAVAGVLVRLPTGKKQDDPANFVDLAPADGQLDVGVSLEGAFEPGSRVGLWFAGAYTAQFGDRLTKRVARVDRPLAPAATETVVDRNLGDQWRASVHPALRVASGFRVFVSAAYARKGADAYTVGGATVADLEALTSMEIWTFGGGVWYRLERNRRGPSLPIEAGLVYDKAVYGSGGAAPRSGRMTLSLRFFYNLWGAAPAPEAEPETKPVGS